MPVIGISSEDTGGDILGNFRLILSVYRFEQGGDFAFLIRKEPVPLNPVSEVERAEFGDWVETSLASRHQRWQVSQDLVLEGVVVLAPASGRGPVIITQDAGLATGDYLTRVDVAGYSLGARNLVGGGLSSLIALA
jgi:hypothetical protein